MVFASEGRPFRNPLNQNQIVQFQAVGDNGSIVLKGRTKERGRFGGMRCAPEVGCEMDPLFDFVAVINAHPCGGYFSKSRPGTVCFDVGLAGEVGLGFWWHRTEGLLSRETLCTEKNVMDWGSGSLYEGMNMPGFLPLHGISCRDPGVAKWLDEHEVK